MDLGMKAETRLSFANGALSGLLLSIAVNKDPRTWRAQFDDLENTLKAKYGDPQKTQNHQSPACKELARCWQDGQAYRTSTWSWGPSYIILRLGRLENELALPVLSVEYFAPPAKSPQQAKGDAF
jgi:hypothetical protein